MWRQVLGMSLQCNGSPVLTQHEKLKTMFLVTVFLVVYHFA